jgi:hypothetical protein
MGGACRRAAAVLACAVALPSAAAQASLPTVTSGHRPGPNILYAPAPRAPQLENTGPWEAEPILVSGATAYRSGEFLYQDYLYDDRGAAGTRDPNDPFSPGDFSFSPKFGTLTYPTDPVFANNAADLVELRVKSLPDATAFRITLNTLRDPTRTAFTIAIGDSAQPHAWPDGAGVSSPAELFLTVHGDQAELIDAAQGTARLPSPAVSVDKLRRQIEVRVPRAAWNPGTSVVRLTAGVGIWDTAAGRYAAPRLTASESSPGGVAPSGAALFNLAFRFDEPMPDVSSLGGTTLLDAAAGAAVDGTWWRERAQANALASGDVSRFSTRVDFAKLVTTSRTIRARRRFRACTRCSRMLKVRVPRMRGRRTEQVVVRYRGKVVKRVSGRNLRRLRLRRPTRRAFTLRLRARTNSSAEYNDESGVPKVGTLSRIFASRFEFGQGADYNKLCGGITAGNEQCDGALVGQLQPYVLYVPLKPTPASGYGLTLLLHSLAADYNQYLASHNQSQLGERGAGSLVATPAGRGPDGFYTDIAEADTFEVWADVARHYEVDPSWTAVSGYSMGGIGTYRLLSRWPDLFGRGMSTVGFPDDFERLPSLRNTPIMAWAATADELVNVAETEQAASDMGNLGLRFVADLFLAADHLTLATNDEYGPAAAFLGEHRVDRNPPHVTYMVEPGSDSARAQTVADHAYWLSDLRLRDAEASHGMIDARSDAFGVGDPKPGGVKSSNEVLEGGAKGPMPYLHRVQEWGPAPATPKTDRLVVEAKNVATATVDARRAGLSCNPQLAVNSDGPLDLRIDCAPAPRARCASRLALRLPRIRGRRVVGATVTMRGRVLKRARGRDLRRISLPRPTRRAFKLRIRLRLSEGGKTRTVTVLRRYGGCGR